MDLSSISLCKQSQFFCDCVTEKETTVSTMVTAQQLKRSLKWL